MVPGAPWGPGSQEARSQGPRVPVSLGSQEARSQGPWGPKRPGPRVPGSQCPRVPESLGSQEARSQGPRAQGPMGSHIGLARKKSSIPKSQDLLEKNNNFEPLIILWHLIGAITPTSILIFIAAFEFGLIFFPILKATLGSDSAPARGALPPRTSRIIDFP